MPFNLMNIDQIQTAVKAIGVPLDAEQAGLLLRYRDLLVEWNARFNLTAITDDEGILLRHFVDSLTVVRALPAACPTPRAGDKLTACPTSLRQDTTGNSVTLLDVGSGAGLPGIALKIARPELDVTLIDSMGKKVTFCETVIKELKLSGIRAVKDRAEEAAHRREHREQYVVVVARALAPLPTLAEYLLPFACVGGVCVAMKGSEAQAEAGQAAKAIRTLGGELARVEPVVLPGVSDQRALVIMRKVRPSPALYPRQAGKPRSAPLSL